jgi:hypothetical protein
MQSELLCPVLSNMQMNSTSYSIEAERCRDHKPHNSPSSESGRTKQNNYKKQGVDSGRGLLGVPRMRTVFVFRIETRSTQCAV